jgi:FKBP-type peptidyl-prolyl cis-trans isomerase 2
MKSRTGKKVQVLCTGKLESGRKIFSTPKDKPLEFKIGAGEILTGLEEIISKMKIGEKKAVFLPPEKGFGYPKKELVKVFAKNDVSKGPIGVGEKYKFRDNKIGRTIEGTVVKVGRDTVTMDFNSPFAGKTTIFEVELLNVED